VSVTIWEIYPAVALISPHCVKLW